MARPEAMTVYKSDVVKKTRAGEATYTYWYASWRESGKIKNVYQGPAREMGREAATEKAYHVCVFMIISFVLRSLMLLF